MFGSMRRKDRELSAEAAQGILERSRYGVLSVFCENGVNAEMILQENAEQIM